LKINSRKIGVDEPPFFIAEMSNNHHRDLPTAKKIIQVAKECGAHAVKLQTYTADSITIDCNRDEFIIKSDVWAGSSYYDLYKSISMPLEWHEELFSFAKQLGIIIFSSPFDAASVELLEGLNCPAYKIASFEASDPVLLKAVADTKKPIIISTGVSTATDIEQALDFLTQQNAGEIALLHCTSSYPAATNQMNINAIDELKNYSDTIGLSDHSIGNIAISSAISKGACIIEKHFTLDRSKGGADASFSIEPNELSESISLSRSIWESLGDKNILKRRRQGSNHARSIFIVQDIKKGEFFTEDNLRIIRPGLGLHPKNFFSLIGKKATIDISRGTPLSDDHVC
jgi:N-acetylneuraminate synthase